jgi:hypothetical protein
LAPVRLVGGASLHGFDLDALAPANYWAPHPDNEDGFVIGGVDVVDVGSSFRLCNDRL